MPQKVNIKGVGNVNFPDDYTEEQIQQAIETDILPSAKPKASKQAMSNKSDSGYSLSNVPQNAGNLIAGAVRGAGSIGSAAMMPIDALKAAISGTGTTGAKANVSQRKQGMDGGLETMGAQPNSGGYQFGKLAGEIAGTAGVGNALAFGTKAPMMANALKSGGFNLGTSGNYGLRIGAGATTGGTAGAMVDPENTAMYAGVGAIAPPLVKGAGELGKLPMKTVRGVLGISTGAGGKAIDEAYKAGKRGATEFLDNVNQKTDFEDVVTMAKQGISNMRLERHNQYRSGMLDISKDKSVLDFSPIDKAVSDIGNMGSYKGVQINKNASGVVDDLVGKVNEWKSLTPAEYHTPEGLDALKQAIGDIRDTTQPNTAARRAADSVYNSVKDQITKQAPTYSKVMKDYSAASKQLSEIEKSLSLGSKAGTDAAVRKLQSVLRNNVNTNFGNRGELLSQLEATGGVDLMPSLAGQSLNSWLPRGLTGSIEKIGAPVMAATNPATAAMLPFMSPRLVGNAAYGLGVANRINPLSKAMANVNYLPPSVLPLISANRASQR